jgi:hypothetical protein
MTKKLKILPQGTAQQDLEEAKIVSVDRNPYMDKP